jgi:hypothetical protein
MGRSRLVSDRASKLNRDNTQVLSSDLGRSRMPLWIVVSSLIVGGIWLFQQVNLRHLNEQIDRRQQQIDRLPNLSIKPADRVHLAKEQIILERELINTQNGVYNSLFQGVGAIILGGLIYTGWQYLRRTDTQSQSVDRKLITDRFSQAIYHLASDKMEVRLGGIYTLERLGQDSPSDDRWLTIEILTAFVRERSARMALLPTIGIPERPLTVVGGIDPPVRKRTQLCRIPTDVQAVMTILSRRDVSKDRPDRIIELRESNLRDANLNRIELRGADLWKSNLQEAQLWQAKLAGASLGRANLSEASLWKADLQGAYLWKANLEGANLTEANLEQANLEGSNLKGANLQYTNLINADLRQVVGLTRQQLSTAIYDETTQLPDYVEFASS